MPRQDNLPDERDEANSSLRTEIDDLKEQISSQNKRLGEKDEEILNRDKQISRLKKTNEGLQTPITQYQKSEEKTKAETENAEITESNTRTTLQILRRKTRELMDDLLDAKNTVDTIREKCNEVQKSLLLFAFFGEVAGVFHFRLEKNDMLYLISCEKTLQRLMNQEDFYKFKEKLEKIQAIRSKDIFAPPTNDKQEKKVTEETKSTLEQYEAETSNLNQKIYDESLTLTEDELQDECHKIQEYIDYIESHSSKRCHFNIQHARDQWKQKKDYNNQQLSEPEKQITRIRDYYWSIRECDKELKRDIQSFIKDIASKTLPDVVEKRKKIFALILQYKDKASSDESLKYKNCETALQEINDRLPQLYITYVKFQSEPFVEYCVEFWKALDSGDTASLKRSWNDMCQRLYYLFANGMYEHVELTKAIMRPFANTSKRTHIWLEIYDLLEKMPKHQDKYYKIDQTKWFVRCQENAANQSHLGTRSHT